jgi:hypothetical protein
MRTSSSARRRDLVFEHFDRVVVVETHVADVRVG